MRYLTNVTVKYGPTEDGKFIFQTERIKSFPNYTFECEYDGRDALIIFERDQYLTIYQKLQIISGLLHNKSNFKNNLFKCFSYLKCNKKLEFIFLYDDFMTLSISKTSIIEQVMRNYYYKRGYVVLEKDNEDDIIQRNQKMLKLCSFIHRRFLEEFNNSDILSKNSRLMFFNQDEEDEYSIKENEILDKRFKEYLSKFELDEDFSEESKQILAFLKNQI